MLSWKEIDDTRNALQFVWDQATQAIGLAAENERLKQDLATLTDVKRIADNIAEMNGIKSGEDNDLFKAMRKELMKENERLRSKLSEVVEYCESIYEPTDHQKYKQSFMDGHDEATLDILAIIGKENKA